MKFSNKIIIYFGGSLILGLMALLTENEIQKSLLIAAFLWQILSSIYILWFAVMLDEGIEKIDNAKKFSAHFKNTKEKTFQILLKKKESFQKQIEEHYSVKVEDKQSKINSLQSQINPHFLYNTLECIRSEAVIQKNDSIAKMAKSLAAFFRYNISRKEDIVTILDELENIKNYIMIQNYRFENKFKFEVIFEDNEQSIYSYLIPKMTIQPIVENSIYHGLETKSGEACLKIEITSTEKDLIIKVSDNGIGMDPSTLKNLRECIERGKKAKKTEINSDVHGNGVALYNVNQRIKLIFGNNYGLSVYSTPDIGTDVEIWIPIIDKM